MKPTIRVATTTSPGGSAIALYLHDGDYSIRVDGRTLMNSRQHESELELSRLGCAQLVGRSDVSVLVGGLGLGYSLRQCLDMVGPRATVTVCELMPAVVEWNRRHLGELTGHPLRDPRVRVKQRNILPLLARHRHVFDAILLDVDNGPCALADTGNRRLYGSRGVKTCRRALKEGGCLAVWSVEPDKAYEETLARAGFSVRCHRVPAYSGSTSQSRFIFVAANDPPRSPGRKRSRRP